MHSKCDKQDRATMPDAANLTSRDVRSRGVNGFAKFIGDMIELLLKSQEPERAAHRIMGVLGVLLPSTSPPMPRSCSQAKMPSHASARKWGRRYRVGWLAGLTLSQPRPLHCHRRLRWLRRLLAIFSEIHARSRRRNQKAHDLYFGFPECLVVVRCTHCNTSPVY